VIAAFGGTAFAAMRMLDTGPDVQTLREQRAQQQAAHERKRGKTRKRARGRRKKPQAGAAAAAAAPSRKRGPRRSWGAKADALCEDAEQESLVLLERYPSRTPTEIVRLLDETVELMAELVRRIERLGPAPNRPVHTRLMRELHASLAKVRQDVAQLKTRFSPARVERALDDPRRTRAINRMFRQLGSPTCAEI
jgi:hypothetical protein